MTNNILASLKGRLKILRENMESCDDGLTSYNRGWYEGKIAGYEDTIKIIENETP